MIISCSQLLQDNVEGNKYVCFLLVQNTKYTRKGFNYPLNSNTLILRIDIIFACIYRIGKIGNGSFAIQKKNFSQW